MEVRRAKRISVRKIAVTGVLAAVVLRRFLKRMPRQDLEAAG